MLAKRFLGYFILLCVSLGTATGQSLPSDLKTDFDTVIGKDADIIVMSQNMYLGADVAKIGQDFLDVSSDELGMVLASIFAIPTIAKEQWQLFLQNKFEERIQAFAQQVKIIQPHVIALQEVALFHTGPPDFLTAGGVGNASHVEADFLDELLKQLEQQGLRYKLAAQVANANIEVPVGKGPTQSDPELELEFDVRLTDRDVILVRNDVVVADVQTGNFMAATGVMDKDTLKQELRDLLDDPLIQLILGSQGIVIDPEIVDPLIDSLTVTRGWASIIASIHGKAIRIVNTHLDPTFVEVQLMQAEELGGMMMNETLPTIALCDFNSDALDPQAPTYNFITTKLGMTDLWKVAEAAGSAIGLPNGVTCCNDDDLSNEDPISDGQRIDIVFARNFGVEAIKVGALTTDQLTTSGLRASNHLGIVAGITFPEQVRIDNLDLNAPVNMSRMEIVSGNWVDYASLSGDPPTRAINGSAHVSSEEGAQVRFDPVLPIPGRYIVRAYWSKWTQSYNNIRAARSAQFEVFHKNGSNTVTFDQALRSEVWRELGEFEFSGAETEGVVLTSGGVANSRYAIADAVEFKLVEAGIAKDKTGEDCALLGENCILLNDGMAWLTRSDESEVLVVVDQNGRVHRDRVLFDPLERGPIHKVIVA